jgi:nicotinamide riboside transporter PnuC
MRVAANLLVLAMSVTFFLLAMQAEIVTSVLGYVFGTMLVLAFIVSFAKKQ